MVTNNTLILIQLAGIVWLMIDDIDVDTDT